MKFRLALASVLLAIVLRFFVGQAHADSPKSKFYDFSEQLIDGQIKKPTTLYIDQKAKVKFDRLLRLKKSFMSELMQTAKEPVFK